MVLHEKKPLAQFTAQIIAQMLFLGKALARQCAAEVLYAYHHLHKILKRWALKGQDLMKLNTF